MTDVVLVRHGETVWHAENRYAGVSDVALTPRAEYRRLFPALRNCALTELRLRAGHAALLQFNTPPVEAVS